MEVSAEWRLQTMRVFINMDICILIYMIGLNNEIAVNF